MRGSMAGIIGLCFLCSLSGSAGAGVFSNRTRPGFLEKINARATVEDPFQGCGLVRKGQTLSRDPLGPPPSEPSLQGERRFMVEARIFACIPTAIAEVARALDRDADQIDEEQLKKARRFLVSAKRWWGRSNKQYVRIVLRVLDATKRPRAYRLAPGVSLLTGMTQVGSHKHGPGPEAVLFIAQVVRTPSRHPPPQTPA
jgi:hypothetical protein